MSIRYCEKCGCKIPTKYVSKDFLIKRTSKKRSLCYECFPAHDQNINGLGYERRRRKKLLIEMHGGKCKKCGYNKSIKALSFHHRNPNTKNFDMSNGGLMKDWDLVLKEVQKCDILCLNCHAELHNSL